MENLSKPTRNYNFDLLKIVSMLMIIALHYFYRTGVANDISFENWSYYFLLLFESLSFVSVNCYALISGYFLADRRARPEKLVNLWFQVIFTSVACTAFTLLPQINAEDVNINTLLRTVFPVCGIHYWYITAYFVFYLLQPFLYWVVQRINKDQHKIICLTLVAVFSLIKTIMFFEDFTQTGRGYSFIWFIVLFFVAAYIRKYDCFNKKPAHYFLLYILFSVISFAGTVLHNYVSTEFLGGSRGGTIFLDYNSIFVFLASVFLFLCFKNLNIKKKLSKKFIGFFAPLTLGIYLIHNHLILAGWLWKNCFYSAEYIDSYKIIIHFFASIIIVFIICALLDYLRQLLFKVLHIDRLAAFVASKIKAIISKIYNSKLIKKI